MAGRGWLGDWSDEGEREGLFADIAVGVLNRMTTADVARLYSNTLFGAI